MYKKDILRNQRKRKIRAKVSGTEVRPRASVFRSLLHISVQLVDDEKGVTLLCASDKEIKDSKKRKAEISYEVGKLIAKKAIDKKINKVIFDRSGYKYHGRVEALAKGMREGGLIF